MTVQVLQVPSEGRPAARQTRCALDLADDHEDILVQQRPVLLRQKFPALQEPLLEGSKPLHLRRRDAVLARHPAQLSRVLPHPPPQLAAFAPLPVQQAPAREERPDPEQPREDEMHLRRLQNSEPGKRPEGGEAHQDLRGASSSNHGCPPRPRSVARREPPQQPLQTARPPATRRPGGPSAPRSSPARARRRGALCPPRRRLSGARSRSCRARLWPPPRRRTAGSPAWPSPDPSTSRIKRRSNGPRWRCAGRGPAGAPP